MEREASRTIRNIVFPAQVSPGVPTPLTVRVVAVGPDNAIRGPLAGVHVELLPSGSTVAVPDGITDADGVFATLATAAPGSTTLTIEVIVRKAPGAAELVRDFAQAAVAMSGGAMSGEITQSGNEGNSGAPGSYEKVWSFSASVNLVVDDPQLGTFDAATSSAAGPYRWRWTGRGW